MKTDWAIMIYMNGDNNLSDDMIANIATLKESYSRLNGKKNVEVYVYFDSAALGYPSFLFDFQEQGFNVKPINYEINSGPKSIYRFVDGCAKKDGFKDIPNYALIISGHGDGFQESSFLKDNNPGGSAKVKDLAERLFEIKTKLLKNNLKILGFDSCVMSSLEVAYEMQDCADFLISSQGYVPNSGWDYGRVLSNMSAKEPKETEEVVSIFLDSLIETYKPFEEYGGNSIDISSCKLGVIPKIDELVNVLATELLKALEIKEEPGRTLLRQLILSSHWQCQTFLFDQCIDLKDFCRILQRECDNLQMFSGISTACKNVVDVISSPNVISQNLGTEFQYASGISLFFPWSYLSYLFTRKKYEDHRFAVTTADREQKPRPWTEFIETYLFDTLRDYIEDSEFRSTAFDKFVKSNPAFLGFDSTSFDDHKVDPKTKDKVDPKTRDKVDPRTLDRLYSVYVENFSRTKNFPWLQKQAVKLLFKDFKDFEK